MYSDIYMFINRYTYTTSLFSGTNIPAKMTLNPTHKIFKKKRE